MALSEESDRIIRAQRASEALTVAGMGPVEWVAETGSTNADLLAAARAGAPHGLIRVAEHQRAGRGRRDRTWTSAPNDALLVSVLVRPQLEPDELGLLTPALGIAAVEACDGLGFGRIRLKWPNDLVVGEPGTQRKLAGILAQSIIEPAAVAVVIGMGLNLVSDRLGQLRDHAIALGDLGPPPAPVELLVAVFSRFAHWLSVIETDPDSMWATYRVMSATLGQRVRVEANGAFLEGPAVDITASGALVVEGADGPVEVVVGDVESLRPAD